MTRKLTLVFAENVFDWASCALVSCVPVLTADPVTQMAAPSDYLDTADLKSVLSGGLIKEDVLDEIFDISDIPTPFLDMIATDSFTNSYSEWTEDKLVAPDTANAAVSGKDIASTDNKANVTNAKRVGNQAQISTKPVMVTTRGQATQGIGRSDEMGYQTARRLQELRRDVEAISLSNQASVADDNNATPGKSAGMPAWMVTNTSIGATGALGGFNTGTKLVAARTVGTARGLTFSFIQAMIEAVYILGGNPSIIMSIPAMTKRLGQYLLTTANSAKPTQNVQGTGMGVAQVSQQFVDAFKTDFGFYMQIIPNRLQQGYGGGNLNCDLFGIDPRYWKLGLLYGWKVEPLAKLGLSDRKMLHVDWMLKAFLERASFMVCDLISTTAVVA